MLKNVIKLKNQVDTKIQKILEKLFVQFVKNFVHALVHQNGILITEHLINGGIKN